MLHTFPKSSGEGEYFIFYGSYHYNQQKRHKMPKTDRPFSLCTILKYIHPIHRRLPNWKRALPRAQFWLPELVWTGLIWIGTRLNRNFLVSKHDLIVAQHGEIRQGYKRKLELDWTWLEQDQTGIILFQSMMKFNYCTRWWN